MERETHAVFEAEAKENGFEQTWRYVPKGGESESEVYERAKKFIQVKRIYFLEKESVIFTSFMNLGSLGRRSVQLQGFLSSAPDFDRESWRISQGA